jgi:hypothetical protein
VILIVGIAILTVYTGFVMGQFKQRYPHVHSIADGGEVLFGWLGREILGTGLLLCLVFVMGGHILTFTVMMNTLTDHGTCSIVFGVVGLLISLILSLPRTFKRVSWLSVICKICLMMSEELSLTDDCSVYQYRCGSHGHDDCAWCRAAAECKC